MTAVQSLLLRSLAEDIVDAPYPHLIDREALPADQYERLQSHFPSLETLAGGPLPTMENAALRLSSKAVLGNPAIAEGWQDFFALHTSSAFWADIVRLFGDHIRRSHPQLEARVGRPLADFRIGRRGDPRPADIRLECQFAINTPLQRPSSVKTPHVDKRETLFAGLFYMRSVEDRSTGGDLELCRWKRRPRFLPYRMILPQDVSPAETVSYAANSFVCFVNSAAAVHGVSPRSPTPLVRRYINLIAEVPFHLFKAPLISLPTALMQWKDVQQTRRQKYG